jgi:hypothetical protein
MLPKSSRVSEILRRSLLLPLRVLENNFLSNENTNFARMVRSFESEIQFLRHYKALEAHWAFPRDMAENQSRLNRVSCDQSHD